MAAVDVLARITDQMRAVLDKQNELAGEAFATDVGFEKMRENYTTERVYWNEGGPVMVETLDQVVAGPDGPVPIRLHRPTAEAGAVIVYVHGGGFVVGNLDTHDRIMRMLADKTGSVVVGVDYSLSPEAKFPQAIHECAAVVHYLRDHADELGIDAAHIALAGDSGGAHLAVATTLHLRDTGAQVIECLLLYYGMYGLRDGVSYRLYGGEWDGLTRADLDYYMACYTNGPEDVANPYIDHLGADLSDLPPCYVAAAEFDPLIDDSKALAALLTEHAIPHRLRVFEGVLHAFLHHSRMLPEAGQAIEDGADFYRSVLAVSAS